MCTRSAFLSLIFLFFATTFATAQQDLEPRPAGPCFLQLKGGSGSTFYRVCISPTGNITRIESPLGVEHLNRGDAVEGWAVCQSDWNPAMDFDAGRDDEDNPGAIEWSYKQPNGPGTFPLTIYHTLSNGLKLEQHFTRNTTERELTVKMYVRNAGTVAATNVVIHRRIDVDAGGDWADDVWASTADSVAIIDGGSPGHGVSLTTDTRNIARGNDAEAYGMTMAFPGHDEACWDGSRLGSVSAAAGDYVATASYSIGTLKPGYAKTVNFVYRVF